MNLGKKESKFYRQQLVEVRSCEEILQTLDSQGTLGGLPFMPEMIAYCGTQIRVHRRADRTCVAGMGFRRMHATVFLQESRCDGSYHDGCSRGCLFFWKEAWLKPVPETQPAIAQATHRADATRALENLVTRRGERYVCQSTELAVATTGQFSRWNASFLLRDIMNGELAVGGFLAIAWRALLSRCFGWNRNRVLVGSIGKKKRGDLGLGEGDWVKVKSAEEIRHHLDQNGSNCGLGFRPTMNVALGRRYRVAFPIQRMIVEQTGKMVQLSNTVALKDVTCQGPCAANCPRDEYLFWRESWLDRSKQGE
ncbi:MAG TPA: hypothetical protein VFS02_01985 [Telluria sp.]|nr:hypothetical protein [Telluria sp.]